MVLLKKWLSEQKTMADAARILSDAKISKEDGSPYIFSRQRLENIIKGASPYEGWLKIQLDSWILMQGNLSDFVVDGDKIIHNSYPRFYALLKKEEDYVDIVGFRWIDDPIMSASVLAWIARQTGDFYIDYLKKRS